MTEHVEVPVPEEAYEAAIAVGYQAAVHGVFAEGSEVTRAELQETVIRKAVDAAAPFIAAKAVEEKDREIADLRGEIDGLRTAVDVRKASQRSLRRERDQAIERVRERQADLWQQALNFCLGSVREYGEGTPEGTAYRGAHTFIERLARQATKGGDHD